MTPSLDSFGVSALPALIASGYCVAAAGWLPGGAAATVDLGWCYAWQFPLSTVQHCWLQPCPRQDHLCSWCSEAKSGTAGQWKLRKWGRNLKPSQYLKIFQTHWLADDLNLSVSRFVKIIGLMVFWRMQQYCATTAVLFIRNDKFFREFRYINKNSIHKRI